MGQSTIQLIGKYFETFIEFKSAIHFLYACRSSHNNSSLLNFTRGSLIELSNGSLRRVEDLRTEDFIMSAEKSTDLQLADSTVVKILSSSNNCVMITFSYDNNRSKVSDTRGECIIRLLTFLCSSGRHRGEA